MAALKELFVSFQADTSQIQSGLRRLDRDLNRTTDRIGQASQRLRNFGRNATLFLTTPLLGFQVAGTLATAEMEGLNATLTSVLKNLDTGKDITQAVAEEMQFMKDMAQELGVSLKSIQRPYVKYLAASKDSLEDTRKVAKSFIAMGAALNIPAFLMEKVIRAIEQMQSKGQIMSEDLKQQLGDTLPGAIKLFAKSIGVGTDELIEMMRLGQVSSEELVKVADTINKDYKDAIELGAKSTRAQLNRMSTGFFLLRASVGKAGNEVFGITDKLERFGKWLGNTADDLDRLDDSGKKILFWAGLFLTVIGPLTFMAGLLHKAFGVMRLGLITLFFPFRFFFKFIKKLPKGIGLILKLVAAIGGAKGLLRVLKILARMSPLGLLLTGAELVISHWQDIVGLFDQAIKKVKEFFGLTGEGVEEPRRREFAGQTINPALTERALRAFGVPQQSFMPQQAQQQTMPQQTIQGGQTTTNSNNTINMSFAAGTSARDKESIKRSVEEAMNNTVINNLFQVRLQE
jgi:tape measure domain-containing protein